MAYSFSYYDKINYPDQYIRDFTMMRGLTLEQDFYRHKAYVLVCVIKGNSDYQANEWAERIREMTTIKFSPRKQWYWIFKTLFVKNA